MTAYLVDYTFATIHQRKRALCEKRQLEEPHLSDSGGKYVSQNVVHAKMFHDILKYPQYSKNIDLPEIYPLMLTIMRMKTTAALLREAVKTT